MSFRKVETPHNTAEQVQQYLDAALRLTEELDVPEDLRQAFFLKAVELVSAKHIQLEQVAGLLGNMAVPRG